MALTRLRFLRLAEYASWALGLAGLVWWGAFQAGAIMSRGHDLERFAAVRGAAGEGRTPDQSLWSELRVAAWRAAVADSAPTPLAVLRIPKLRLEVSLLPGTDDRTLDRAVGHIEGTSAPGTEGNVGIAGHRDSYFRGLKDIEPGDLVELETPQEKSLYRVERTWIVDPEDVSVLDSNASRSLTLVTCYPFYFVGAAPRRFIVRAVPTSRVGTQVIAESAQKWRE